MLALRTSSPAFTPAEAERIARDLYAIAAVARPLPGERDSNHHLRTADGREFVLKMVDPHAPALSTDCQIRVLRHLAEQDPALPVPRILPTAAGEDVGRVEREGVVYEICLADYRAGELLAQRRPTAPLLESLGFTLGRLDRALQGFFHPALAPRLAWDVRRLPELAAQHAALIEPEPARERVHTAAAAVEKRMSALRSLRSQAIHGDCHGANLLVDAAAQSISGIIDFGDMLHAPRVLEPAVTLSELLTDDLVPLEAVGTVLRAYGAAAPLEAEEVDALYDLIAARHAITILVHAWRSRHDPPGARRLDRSAVQAAGSLESLAAAGAAALTRIWHDAVGTRAPAPVSAASAVSLERRRRLLGAGAELFYDEPLHIVRGAGVWLTDAAGLTYLDVYNNVPHVGHAHPTVVAAIGRQVASLVTHTRYLHAGILEYAERLTATLPAALDACMFVNSGSEANDVAWRLARFATGHEGGMVIEHAYHGITDAVAALTLGSGRPRDHRIVTLATPRLSARAHVPMRPEELHAATLDAERALATLEERGLKPAACYIDSALTSSGIVDPPAAWTAAWSARVRAAGALIVGDEVQYGLGRSGSHLWGFERRGLVPDIVTLGKPVGNGFPMGVVIAPRALIESFQARYGFFSTFGGNPVAAAAGLAVLEVLEREQLMANAAMSGEYLRARLEALAARHRLLGAVRGAGLLLGLEVRATGTLTARQAAKFVVNHLAARSRVLIGSEGPHGDVLKMRPPMPFRTEHADRLLAALEAAVSDLEQRP